MTRPGTGDSVLGIEIDKRLTQLGFSRREFSRKANIGRQTLQDIIHDPNHRISERTFAALDIGLKWEAGTAKAFHEGDQHARDRQSVDERINTYILQILQRLAEMSVDELEREVLILEEESIGFCHDSETSRLIERQIQKLVASLLDPHDGDGDESEKESEPPHIERGNDNTITAGD